jgi:hypothetical protein
MARGPKNMNMRIRSIIAAFLLAAALPVAAQQAKPPVLQPIPEPPPPPPGYELGPGVEPEVTILKRGNDTVEEYRLGGKLYMIKVTPANGAPPYYMVDQQGDGRFARQDPSSGIHPPQWVIFQW